MRSLRTSVGILIGTLLALAGPGRAADAAPNGVAKTSNDTAKPKGCRQK